MRIYLQPPQPSRGLQRIADALVRYKPEWVEAVPTQAEAELVIIYAIGRRERVTNLVEYLLATGRKYAVIQVCLRSTMSPNTKDWIWSVWADAEVVWSYYNLERAVAEDRAPLKLDNFYHSPLGADAGVFRDPFVSSRWASLPKNGRNFIVATSGSSYLSESVRECWLAAKAVDGEVYHVGPPLRTNPLKLTFSAGCNDQELALHYSACEFVSGLRRKEGFELPAVEGLLCGARPIVFKGADWEWNYGNHAIYIEETDRQGVIDQLVQLFRHGAPPVTPEERERAVERYDWKRIIGGFYERLL